MSLNLKFIENTIAIHVSTTAPKISLVLSLHSPIPAIFTQNLHQPKLLQFSSKFINLKAKSHLCIAAAHLCGKWRLKLNVNLWKLRYFCPVPAFFCAELHSFYRPNARKKTFLMKMFQFNLLFLQIFFN